MNKNQQLLISAANGDLQGLIDSLTSGADINTKDSNGFSALQFATYNSQLQIIEVLVESNADPNVFDYKNYNNYTPLHYAASFNQIDIVKALLKSKTNPHIPNGEGKYPVDLTTSDQLKNMIYEDLERRGFFGVQQPQPQFQPQQVDSTEQPQPTGCRWNLGQVRCCKLFKKAKKIMAVLFLLFPILYCIFTPFGFPWFIYPCALILSIKGFKKIREHKEELKTEGVYKFYIHALVYTVLNVLNFIACLWWKTIFFASSVAVLWGSFLAIHALKSKYQKSKKNNAFFIHALIFGGLLISSFITYTHISCMPNYHQHQPQHQRPQYRQRQHPGYGSVHGHRHHHERVYSHHTGCNRNFFAMFVWFSPMMVWAVILFFHYLKHNGQAEFSCCGIKISFGNSESHQEGIETTENMEQENVEINQNQQEINVQEQVPDFNLENVQTLYPKVL